MCDELRLFPLQLMNRHSAPAENLLPFANINKRTSRLAANLTLFRDKLRPLAFLEVPVRPCCRTTRGVYELTRVEFA